MSEEEVAIRSRSLLREVGPEPPFGGDLMSAGRRGLILALVFLGLALWLCPAQRVQAQRAQPQRKGRFEPPPPQPRFQPNNNGGVEHHSIWQRDLTADQIRDMLAKFGAGNGKADDQFVDFLRRIIQDKNRNVPPEQVDALTRRLMEDKEFRDQIIDLAQKLKNQQPNNANGNNGPVPRPTREDIAKLLKFKPEDMQGDPFKVPRQPKNADPNQFPPFDPRNPNFDPKLFPKIDPNNPPQFDPNTHFPIDPKTDKPFDPRNGQPIDPQRPPKIDVPPNPAQPPNPPQVLPPQVPNKPDNNRKFDPENPLGTPKESPERAAKTKAVETATALWEKNVGPIEDSPAVRRAIIDLVNDNEAMDALTDGKGNSIFDMLEKDSGNGEKFGDWFKDTDSKWEWPKFDFNWSRGRGEELELGSRRDHNADSWWSRDSSRTRGSSSLDSMGSFHVGSMHVPVLLLLILLLLIVAAVVWWKWRSIFQPQQAVGGVESGGGWPIDPREINTREDVVKAFEYLSVLICGASAKTWTHSTIADELSELATTEPETALKLARLYELARYAPLDEPLTRAEVLEARRLVCELAGMDDV